MGKLLDFLGKISESSIEITDPVVNNYYITIDNRAIKVTESQFIKLIKENKLRIEDKTKLLEEHE